MKFTKPNSRSSKSSKSKNGSNSSGKSSVKKKSKENRGTCNAKQPDNSVLRLPVDTSVSGLKQAVRLFETGTPEVLHLMSYECDIIYECRVCRNLFRSVANFISHKRLYCTRKFNHVESSQVVEDHTILVDSDSALEQSILASRLTAREDLTMIIQKASAAQYYKEAEDKTAIRDAARLDTTVHLQPIENTTFGVYQTVLKPANDNFPIKNQISELQNILTKREEVTLGPDGKIVQENGEEQQLSEEDMNQRDSSNEEEHILSGDEHVCGLCKTRFSSKKTLSHHTKTVHNTFRLSYTCPCCKNLFTNSWSVLRHLYKVHRKSNEQVRRLRAQIQRKQVLTEKLAKKHDVSKSNIVRIREGNAQENKAWINHFEDNSEVQRCAGCGRRFERRAALLSHAQICHKRIALCSNSMPVARFRDEKVFAGAPAVDVTVGKQQQTPQSSPIASTKPSSEKRIGIQVRMNYCKNGGTSSNCSAASKVRRSERHRSCEEESCDGQLTLHSTEPRAKTTTLNFSEGCDDKSVDTSLDLNNIDDISETDLPSTSDSSKNTSRPNNLKPGLTKLKVSRLEIISKQLREAVESELKNFTSSDSKGGCLIPNGLASHSGGGDEDNEVEKEEDGSDIAIQSSVQVPEKENSEDCIATCETKRTVVDSNSSSGRSSNSDCVRTRTSLRLASNENSVSDSKESREDCEESECVKSVEVKRTEGEKERRPQSSVSPDGNILELNSDLVSSLTEEDEAEAESDNQRIAGNTDSISPSKEGVIRVLTRFQLKSICKKDIEENNSKHMEPEDLNIVDGSSLKENLDGEVHSPNWLHEKMKNYIHFKTTRCLVCHEKFKTVFHLKQHVADHFGWNRFKCLMRNCTFVTYAKVECAKHLIKMHLKPHEKHLALDYVDEIKNTSGNCDIDIVGSEKAFSKKKVTIEKDSVSVKQSVLKEAIGGEMKVTENKTVGTTVEEISERTDGKRSVMEGNKHLEIVSKNKKRKTNSIGSRKMLTPPVRKCSPDSTTEPVEKTIPDGAQYQHGKSKNNLIQLKKSKT